MSTPPTPAKPGTSWVWTYFRPTTKEGKAINVCHAFKADGDSLCLKELAVDRSGSTKSMINHLQRKHSMIRPDSTSFGSIPVVPRSSGSKKPAKPKRERPKATTPRSLNREALVAATARTLIDFGVSYDSLGKSCFLELLELCNPATKALATDPQIIREHVQGQFLAARVSITSQIESLDSFISLTCNAWTSPAGHPMLEVFAHWIDNEWVHQSVLLAFIRLDGPHTEENVSTALYRVLASYNIENRILCITADKISYTALSGATLNKLISQFHPSHHLVGCLSHVIDLAGQAILTEFQDGPETIVKIEPIATSINVNPSLGHDTKTIIRRLHGLADRLKSSPEAKEKFVETASLVVEGDPTDVFFNSSLSWSSAHVKLERAVKLRDAMSIFCSQDDASSPFQISPSEWERVQQLLRFLKPLERLTKDLTSGAHCPIMAAAPTFEWVVKRTKKVSFIPICLGYIGLTHPLLTQVLTDEGNLELAPSALLMQSILDTHQSSALQKPVYLCAPILDPRIKLSPLEDESQPAQSSLAENVKEIFKGHAKQFDQHSNLAYEEMNGGLAADSSDDDSGPRFLKRRKKFTGFDGEIASYFNGETEDEACDPFEFWKDRAKSLPSLSRMAQTYLAVQASTSSCSPESHGRRGTLAVLEQDLSPEDIEAFACLKAWSQSGAFKM